MKIPALRSALSQFEQVLQPIIHVNCCEWLASVDARWLDQRGDGFNNRFGIYFYSMNDGEILYIGKAQESALVQRIWSHLQTPCRERHASPDRVGLKLYPSHQWKGANDAKKAVADVVESGDFCIDGLALEPKDVAGLFENFALTYCQLSEGCLPSLNLKLG